MNNKMEDSVYESALESELRKRIQELERKNEALESKYHELATEKNILDTLCGDFESFYYLDFLRDEIVALKRNPNREPLADPAEERASLMFYMGQLDECFEKFVDKKSAPDFVQVLSPENLKECMKNSSRFTYRFSTIKISGVQHHLEVSVVRIVGTESAAVMGFRQIDDIIAQEGQKKAELKDINSKLEAQLHMIGGLSNAYFAVYWVDTRNNTCQPVKNIPFFEQVTGNGTNTKEVTQAFVELCVQPEDKEKMRKFTTPEIVAASLAEHDVAVEEFHGTLSPWEWCRASWIVASRDEDTGIVRNVLFTVEDITANVTERKQRDEALTMALAAAEHANYAKTQFLNNMSHDIRTPMNAVIGFTSLAASHIDNKEKVKEYLRKIETSSEHLLSLINDVLDMSRIESGKVKIDERPLSLPDLLHDIRTIIQPTVTSKQLDFLIDTVDVVDEDIIADKLRLTQILLNILGNGVKFNKTGGLISLRVRQEKKAPKGCARYHFVIKDTGIGISKEFQEHIFENFSRAENSTVSGIQGTGLGLAITKKLVDMMGGTITLKSEEGVGSEFDVCMTFKLSGEKKVYEKIESLQGLRVLVADDDTDTCLSISAMLSEIGMRSEWTVSGKEAVVRAKYAIDMGDEFYAYIIDWLMPDMNGIETVRRIRKVIGDSKPIIILTAYDWSDVEDEAREAGVTAFCEKPLFMSELRDILSQPVRVEAKKDELDLSIIQGRRVLLVEDNELNQEIAVEILQDAGFAVDVANDGSVAVDIMEKSQAGYYDVVLMDIQMPIMNGYDATKQIRAMDSSYCREVPIIAMTANAFDEDRELAIQSGMSGYLAKPIQIDNMLKIIGSLL